MHGCSSRLKPPVWRVFGGLHRGQRVDMSGSVGPIDRHPCFFGSADDNLRVLARKATALRRPDRGGADGTGGLHAAGHADPGRHVHAGTAEEGRGGLGLGLIFLPFPAAFSGGTARYHVTCDRPCVCQGMRIDRHDTRRVALCASVRHLHCCGCDAPVLPAGHVEVAVPSLDDVEQGGARSAVHPARWDRGAVR